MIITAIITREMMLTDVFRHRSMSPALEEIRRKVSVGAEEIYYSFVVQGCP